MIPNRATAASALKSVEPAVGDSSCRQAADVLTTIMPTSTADVDSARRLEGALAVLVRSNTPGHLPQTRAKLLLTLPAARRALAAARGRGHQAEALLVELHVIGGVE